jgi:hypothetical protein
MPFQPHIRLTFRGAFTTPAVIEEFSFGVNCAPIQGTPNAPNQAMLDSAVDAVGQYWARPALQMPTGRPIREVKVAAIGVDGKYTSDPMIAAVNLPGGASEPQYLAPPQVALVVSLNTGRRGPTGRGRWYLPCPSYRFLDDLVLSTPLAQAVANESAAFLKDLETTFQDEIVGGLLVPVVASSKGYNTVVTSVRVGRVTDTMRSRRTSLPEQYGANVDSTVTVG